MQAVPGFLPFYLDRQAGRLYFAIDRFGEDMIYQTGLPQGVGSNDLGFDRVELLPPEADPMGVRYNVIQWVHRATRGGSYGSSAPDPRTGEIIKGKVTLGSLRVRQDWLIAQGMTSPFETGKEPAPELTAMALALIRQLSAHEVGHTLGLAHNFAASGTGDPRRGACGA